MVDELGILKAQIAALQEEERELIGAIKRDMASDEITEMEGDLYRVTLSSSMRKTTAWKKIAMDLGATAQRIKGNTAATLVSTLRITARKTA
jgi:hypothetical protein